MQKEYNVISKKEFIIYLAFAIVNTIMFLYDIYPKRTIKDVIETILLTLMFYIAPILGWVINIIFNFWKINNKKVKLIIKILFNIFAVLYTICLFILILGVNLLFSE